MFVKAQSLILLTHSHSSERCSQMCSLTVKKRYTCETAIAFKQTEEMIDGQTRRTQTYESMQQPGFVCAVNLLPADALGVQGQRVRPQPESFWSYYPGDVGVFCKKSTSWRPQSSRITRDNRDYMTALARGLSREEKQPLTTETNEIFSSRWHQRLPTATTRPSTGKSSTTGSRPPIFTTERGKLSVNHPPEHSRPTTAPVTIDKRFRRVTSGRARPILATDPPTTSISPPAVPYRVSRLVETSGNFDNLTNSTFYQLAGELKPSVLKGDNHFVHQLCLNTGDSAIDQLNTSRDSFPDISNSSPSSRTSMIKQESPENPDHDQDENETESVEQTASVQSVPLQCPAEQVEMIDDLPTLHTASNEPPSTDQLIIEQEADEDILERENNVDEYGFEFTSAPTQDAYEYPDPFTEEYDQVIAGQAQFSATNGNHEPNFRDLYRDNRIRPDPNPNVKAVFEKCIKLARCQASTIKWEQRRRQSMFTYNRLLKASSVDASTTNLTGSVSAKNNEKDLREMNDIKRDLRCNECKRISCLGNCAAGQNYHLYKRIVSSIPSQSSLTRQQSAPSRDQPRCKHGYTTCPISACRTATADLVNSNAMLNSPSTTAPNRVRSARTSFTYGQKNQQRPTFDIRPRSVRQATRDVKMKLEQANVSPIVVVPLFEDESRSVLGKSAPKRSTNGLLPGKSFRSQRRDSLTMIAPPKISS